MIRAALMAVCAALLAASITAASASAAPTSVSSNWSGYAVTGTTFSTISGSWTQPVATCSASSSPSTASAFWVGLGGDSTTSNALEQVGTEADCSAGVVHYSAWYELVPKASVKLALAVSAGDRLSASVRVEGTKVVLTLENLTTNATFSKALAMASPDTSSAEWVAEAPSFVTSRGEQVLPLTDFGSVTFSKAAVTSTAGHTGSISDSAWSATRIQLESESGGPGPYGQFADDQRGATEAVPGLLVQGGDVFTVTWRRTASSPSAAFA